MRGSQPRFGQVQRVQVVGALKQLHGGSSSIDRLNEDVPRVSTSCRAEENSPAVRRPGGNHIRTRFEQSDA